MLRVLLLSLALALSSATTCSQLRTLYSDIDCCAGSSTDTCLREIPLCASVNNGYVCVDTSGNIVVKGLLDAFDFPGNQITLKKHIIPDTNSAYDLGNAEYKIRYLFKTDN